MTTAAPTATHPLVGVAREMRALLAQARSLQAHGMTAEEKQVALLELSAVGSGVAELSGRVLVVAHDVAEATGARDAGAWLAHATRRDHSAGRAALRLAQGLDRHPRLAEAVAAGQANVEQAKVIIDAVAALPTGLGPELAERAEESLVGFAAVHPPRELRRLGEHILEVVAPEIAEAEEAKRLERLEQEARETASLRVQSRGPGRGRLILDHSSVVIDRILALADAFASPRRDRDDDREDRVVLDDHARTPLHRRRAWGLQQLVETLDPAAVPRHGGASTTVVVTMTLDALREDLATAGVLGHDEHGLSAAEARRLACEAKVVPMVLGGRSEQLDLGRSRRLFSSAQRLAMRLRDKVCRAEGCDIPATWCEAHHWRPWSQGGSTDLDDGGLVCSLHHHRIHDRRYRWAFLPDGQVRFHRRE